MKGMTTCKVCGRDFPLIFEEHYVAHEPGKTGLVTIVNGQETQLFDTFDCPHCGCQNTMQVRKPSTVSHVEEAVDGEFDRKDNPDFDGCDNCVHRGCSCEEEPCNRCRHNFADYYTDRRDCDE